MVAMDRKSGIEQIQNACDQIARELMRIHPAVPALDDPATQGKTYEALYRITTDVEVIKKLMLKLRGRDASTDL